MKILNDSQISHMPIEFQALFRHIDSQLQESSPEYVRK